MRIIKLTHSTKPHQLRAVHQFVPRRTPHRILNYVDAFIRVDYYKTTKTVYLDLNAALNQYTEPVTV